MDRVATIRERLERELAPESVVVIDDSHRHVGHEGARGGLGHFTVRIRAAAFAGRSLLERHRMVYEALGTLMQTDIHALAVEAKAPGE